MREPKKSSGTTGDQAQKKMMTTPLTRNIPEGWKQQKRNLQKLTNLQNLNIQIKDLQKPTNEKPTETYKPTDENSTSVKNARKIVSKNDNKVEERLNFEDVENVEF